MVGVGLIELKQIPVKLDALGLFIATGMYECSPNKTLGLSIFLYFVICGFLFGYLWGRLYMPGAFDYAAKIDDEHESPGPASVSSSGASAVVKLKVSNYMTPYSLPAVAADVATSSLLVVTRTASMRKPLFASNLCLRSKPLTKSRVALPIAPAMLPASTFIVRPSEPALRSSYFNVTLYVFKAISLDRCYLRVGFVNSV